MNKAITRSQDENDTIITSHEDGDTISSNGKINRTRQHKIKLLKAQDIAQITEKQSTKYM